MYHYFVRPIVNIIFATLGVIVAISLIVLLTLRRQINKIISRYVCLSLIIKLHEVQRITLEIINERADEANISFYTVTELMVETWEKDVGVVQVNEQLIDKMENILEL